MYELVEKTIPIQEPNPIVVYVSLGVNIGAVVDKIANREVARISLGEMQGDDFDKYFLEILYAEIADALNRVFLV